MKSSREQFEEWAVEFYGWGAAIAKRRLDDKRYELEEIDNYWTVWQASRQALANEEVTTAPFVKVVE